MLSLTESDIYLFRQALLLLVDWCERKLGITPRTAELRRDARQELRIET